VLRTRGYVDASREARHAHPCRARTTAIIGRETFSAAMNLATDLKRETRALFVGELTGSSPNHFGENGPISLPHTGLHATAAMYWYQHSDPRDHRPWIEPDLPAPLRPHAGS